jgi:hypothetical protein
VVAQRPLAVVLLAMASLYSGHLRPAGDDGEEPDKGSSPPTPEELLTAALDYRERGWSVVPAHWVMPNGKCSCGKICSSPGKHPMFPWAKYTKVLPTVLEIKQWWAKWPKANIAIITGTISNLAILDIDGTEGVDALAQAGYPIEMLPETPLVETGSGLHYYYRMSDEAEVKTKAGLLDHVDIRAEGGLVIAPPSWHNSGKRYRWINSPDRVTIYELDWSQLTGLRKPSNGGGMIADGEIARLLKGVGEGERNEAMTKLIGSWYGRFPKGKMSEEEALLFAQGVNLRNRPPMPDSELQTIVHSVAEAQAREDEAGAVDEDVDYRHGYRAGDKELLAGISKSLGLQVLKVHRVTGDQSKIIMHFRAGKITLSVADAEIKAKIRRAVREATGVTLNEIGACTIPTWKQVSQWILDVAEPLDAGDEATEEGETSSLIKSYLATKELGEITDDHDVPPRGPFQYDGKYWINLPETLQWAKTSLSWPESGKVFSQRLTVWGASPRKFRVEHRATRTLWGFEPAWLEQ